MYKRNEVIEEEHLNWDRKSKEIVEDKDLKVTLSPKVKHDKSLPNEKNKKHIISTSKRKISIIKETKEITSNMGEKTIFFLLLIIFPYLLGLFLFFILVPIFSGLSFNILFVVIDFSDWATHFLFWSIGYVTLTFLGISLVLYKPRH